MAEQSHASAARPRSGTGRLGIVSGYFVVVGSAAAFAALCITYSMLRPHGGVRSITVKELAILLGALSLTFGCFRTSRLLDRREREGVVSAFIMFAAPIAGCFSAIQPSVAIVSGCVVGIALLASVWRHLRE